MSRWIHGPLTNTMPPPGAFQRILEESDRAIFGMPFEEWLELEANRPRMVKPATGQEVGLLVRKALPRGFHRT